MSLRQGTQINNELADTQKKSNQDKSNKEYMPEPASAMRGDSNMVEVLTPRADKLEAPRFPDHNDEDMEPNGDDMVTPWRCETHMSCESTDILANNTYQATRPGCGGVRGNIIDTHKDTRGPDSH